MLPAERPCIQALSPSRLAYDLESLFSLALAADQLSLITYHWLFSGKISKGNCWSVASAGTGCA